MERHTQIRTRAVTLALDAQRRFVMMSGRGYGSDRNWGGRLRENIPKIEDLLRTGRDAEAILLANISAFYDTGGADELLKANYDPNEPRDERGRWTNDAGSNVAHWDTVQYRGHFHDALVDDFLSAMEKVGARTAKNIGVIGANGVLAIPDGLILPAGATKPYFVEVKTGFDPPFTANQRQVYPLICTGYHSTSFDTEIAPFGLKPGSLLPPMDILVVYAPAPGKSLSMGNYCDIIRGR